MNKKFIFSILFSLTIIIMISFFCYSNKTMVSNNDYLAINVDGVRTNAFPIDRKYSVDITCFNKENEVDVGAKAIYNRTKNRWSIEFNKITQPNFMCEVNFTSSNDPCKIPGYLCSSLLSNNSLKSIDDMDGLSYYFSGDSETNYVRFANLDWRVIRVNGDNSIRLILANPAMEDGTLITVPYNNSELCINPNLSTDSITCSRFDEYNNIYLRLNDWYKLNISGSDKNFVIKNKYCNDLANYSTLDQTRFGSYIRNEEYKTPSLKCNNHYDTDNSNTLIVNDFVGLISYDEVSLLNENKSYLNNILDTWTISPKLYSVGNSKLKSKVDMYLVEGYVNVTESKSFAPVINVNKYTLIEGDGSLDNPYLLFSIEKP